MSSKKRLLQLFGLPKDEIIFEDFSCAYQDGILKHGRIFIAENYICFYATVLGFKTKRVISVNDIQEIKKETVLGFINNAIEIKTKDNKSHFFCSFWNREIAYQLLYGVWKGEPLYDIDKGNGSDKDESLSEIGSQSGGDSLVVEQSDVEILNPETSEENKELLKCILPVSVDSFFEKFVGDNAIFSFQHHMEKNGATDIKVSEWSHNQELSCYTRECNLIIKVQGVPLRDSSRFQKIQTYKKEGIIGKQMKILFYFQQYEQEYFDKIENNCKRIFKRNRFQNYYCPIQIYQFNQKYINSETLIVSSTSRVFDLPYCGYFTTEEKWEVTPVEGSNDKCLLVCKGWVTFNKNTIMKKTITQRNEQALKEDYEIWIGRLRKALQAKKAEEAPQQNKQQFEQVLTKDELNLNKINQNQIQTKKQQKLASSGKIVGTQEFNKLNMGINILIGLLGLIILLIALDILIFNNNFSRLERKVDDLEKIIIQLTQQIVQQNQNQNYTQFSNITITNTTVLSSEL